MLRGEGKKEKRCRKKLKGEIIRLEGKTKTKTKRDRKTELKSKEASVK
jgi:hypothetical protein